MDMTPKLVPITSREELDAVAPATYVMDVGGHTFCRLSTRHAGLWDCICGTRWTTDMMVEQVGVDWSMPGAWLWKIVPVEREVQEDPECQD